MTKQSTTFAPWESRRLNPFESIALITPDEAHQLTQRTIAWAVDIVSGLDPRG